MGGMKLHGDKRGQLSRCNNIKLKIHLEKRDNVVWAVKRDDI